MKEQLIQYVELLFAGASDCTEMKQEILQNTLDRYDDLIDQGKSPEAAYRLAILGIGDIQEVLGADPAQATAPADASGTPSAESSRPVNRFLFPIAVAMYILCLCPVMLLENVGDGSLGVVLMFLMIAVATGLLIYSGKGIRPNHAPCSPDEDAKKRLRRSVKMLVCILGVVVYFVISFATNAWQFTWLLLLVTCAVEGLVTACMDLKEATRHEN